MYDELYMNIETGEVASATEAIREYYKDHGALDAWTDLWVPTGMLADVLLDQPDFVGAICV